MQMPLLVGIATLHPPYDFFAKLSQISNPAPQVMAESARLNAAK
jgi:hypothetical protein